MQDSNKNVKNLLVFILILTSFFLWYIISDKKAENTENSTKNITTNSWKLDLSLVWEVFDEIKSEFYWIDWIKNDDIVSWMVDWMVSSLWDKHSEYMSKEEKESFEETLAWDFEWIWAVVEKLENYWVKVSMVVKDSPAKNSWILVWDVITKADSSELKDLNLYDAVNLIKWKAWTKVKLTILRSTEIDPIEKEITRKKINIPSVQTEVFEDKNIAYIALNMFWDTASEEFKTALKEMQDKKVDGIIIDLRDNWWWYLQSSVEILSNFMEKWKVLVKTKFRDSKFDDMYYSNNKWNIFDKKIVVLINWNSASASEITAWALREYDKAILVWEKTFWKWSVQEPFDLSNWWLLKLTIANWFTPNWVNIDKEWIKPDVEIKYIKEDYEKQYDRQLEEAKKVLESFIKNWSLQIAIDKYKENTKEKE